MKRFYAFLIAMTATTLLIVADVLPTKFYVWQKGQSTAYDIDAEKITYGDGTLTVKGVTYLLADIDSITFAQPDTTTVASDTVYVTFSETSASVAPNVEGVTASINGANVELTNTNEDREMCFVLSGSSTSGQFVYNGTYKTTICLSGLTLTGSTAEAINIKCGKRILLWLAEGTVNTLADASTDGGQKAAFYTKGHLEVDGEGTLNLTGNVKHGLSSKEYLQVKKSMTGTIRVLKAAADGIHAGQYYRQSGGNVRLTAIVGDGIQAEVTEDNSDEQNGQLIVRGGSLDITVSGNDAAALKSDSLMTISGGDFTLTTTGSAVKGLKSKTNMAISGGTFVIKQSGGYLVENGEASYTTALKADGELAITGGDFSITTTGSAARGLSADGNIVISEADGPTTLTITDSGTGETNSTLNDNVTAKGISGDKEVRLLGGTLTISMSGTAGKGIKADGAFIMGSQDTASGPILNVTTTGSSLGGNSGGGGGWWWAPGGGPGGGGHGGGGPGGQSSGGSSAKAIKAQGTATLYGGALTVSTSTNGAEGLESKTSVTIAGGQHYLKCYDDCINSSGNIYFNGGVTVCYSTGNDAVDSNAGRTGAITIGNGTVLAYTTKGSPEEGLDCDNNSYIQITGTGIGLSAGGSQGGGSSSTISNARQGYTFLTSSISYQAGRYYTLADASGKNLVTYSFPAALSSTLSLVTATGMVKGSAYTVKYSTTAPTDATTVFHGLYLGSTHQGTTQAASFTAK